MFWEAGKPESKAVHDDWSIFSPSQPEQWTIERETKHLNPAIKTCEDTKEGGGAEEGVSRNPKGTTIGKG